MSALTSLVTRPVISSLAFGNYRWEEERETFRPRSISVLTLGRGGIAEITTFSPELFAAFGLPDALPAQQTTLT